MSSEYEERLLGLIADTQGLLDIGELRLGMLDAVNRAVPSDYVSLNDVGPDPATTVAVTRPQLSAAELGQFAELAHENPLVRRYTETRDGRAYRFSDVVTRRELHSLRIYREFYSPLGIEHQMAFTLPSQTDRILAVALSRRRRDFSDQERDLVDRARPFLIQAYQNAVAHQLARAGSSTDPAILLERLRAAGLTAREAEVVRLTALGASNRDVGAVLGITERTVAKHLERCFGKLGARNRSEASARVWAIAAEPADAVR